MKYCRVCKTSYEISYQFCLQDGTILTDENSSKTLQFSDVESSNIDRSSLDVKSIVDGLTRLQLRQSLSNTLRALYTYEGYDDIELDARFVRFIDSKFDTDPEGCIEFVDRLLRRAKLSYEKNRENNDIAELYKALSEPSHGKTSDHLRGCGLL